MHYACLVVLDPEDEELRERIVSQMVIGKLTEGTPNYEELTKAIEEEMGERAEWWDWWEVGGRWSGHLSGSTVKRLADVSAAEYVGCFAHVVVEGWGHFAGERYVPWAEADDGKFVAQELPPLTWLQKKCPNGIAVVVDPHN